MLSPAQRLTWNQFLTQETTPFVCAANATPEAIMNAAYAVFQRLPSRDIVQINHAAKLFCQFDHFTKTHIDPLAKWSFTPRTNIQFFIELLVCENKTNWNYALARIKKESVSDKTGQVSESIFGAKREREQSFGMNHLLSVFFYHALQSNNPVAAKTFLDQITELKPIEELSEILPAINKDQELITYSSIEKAAKFPLHMACKLRAFNIIERLLDLGADENRPWSGTYPNEGDQGATPLHLLFSSLNDMWSDKIPSVIKKFITNGVDPSLRSTYDQSLPYLPFSVSFDRCEKRAFASTLYELLHTKGGYEIVKNTILHYKECPLFMQTLNEYDEYFKEDCPFIQKLLFEDHADVQLVECLIENNFKFPIGALELFLAQKFTIIGNEKLQNLNDPLVIYLLGVYSDYVSVQGDRWYEQPALLAAVRSMRRDFIRIISKNRENHYLWKIFWVAAGIDVESEENNATHQETLDENKRSELLSLLMYLVMIVDPKSCFAMWYLLNGTEVRLIPINELETTYPMIKGLLMLPGIRALHFPIHHLCESLTSPLWATVSQLIRKELVDIWQVDDAGNTLLHSLSNTSIFQRTHLGEKVALDEKKKEQHLRELLVLDLLKKGLDPNCENKKGEVFFASPHWTERMRLSMLEASKVPLDRNARPKCMQGLNYVEWARSRGEINFAQALEDSFL